MTIIITLLSSTPVDEDRMGHAEKTPLLPVIPLSAINDQDGTGERIINKKNDMRLMDIDN